MTRVLFVCVQNAGRSQMAEALAAAAGLEARSSGSRPAGAVHPAVVEVMHERGVDLSGRTPRSLLHEDVEWADVVVTMGCGDACPVLPGTAYRDWELADPHGQGLDAVRAIRDDIERRVAQLAGRAGEPEPVVVRTAREADAESIGDLHVRAWQWAYDGLMPPQHLASLDPDRRAAGWRSVLVDPAQRDPYVAEQQGSIVGFVHQGPSRDRDADATTGEVTAIYLAPEVVGTGVGYALWSAALHELRRTGHSTVTVWVLATNERGIRFYERAGLRPDGETKTESRGGFDLHEVRYRGAID